MPKHTYSTATRNGNLSAQAMQAAASDMFLLSLCDYHVLSPSSGFGQKSAFLSSKPKRDHIFYPFDATSRLSKCTLSNPTDPAIIASKWSGV